MLIQALDQNSTVTYKGETDVTIISGNIAQVSLTLQQVQSGVGGIYIYVKWGSSSTTSSQWTDYLQNPILSRLDGYLDPYGVVSPYVLYDGGKYKMWFTNAGAYGTIGYAESSDGYHWSRVNSQPVMSIGTTGWDAGSISSGPVIIINGMYYMYYSGIPKGSTMDNAQGGLATSQDGIYWTKRSIPVLAGASGWESSVIPSDVIKIGNTYYMYYTARQYPTYKIGLATSTDGISWTKYGSPILSVTQPWEGYGIYNATIIQDSGKYVMVYQNSYDVATAFGRATSTDGINWTKDPANPIFTQSNTANHWINYIQYPCIRKNGDKTLLFYSGYDPNANLRTIAVATKTN